MVPDNDDPDTPLVVDGPQYYELLRSRLLAKHRNPLLDFFSTELKTPDRHFQKHIGAGGRFDQDDLHRLADPIRCSAARGAYQIMCNAFNDVLTGRFAGSGELLAWKGGA